MQHLSKLTEFKCPANFQGNTTSVFIAGGISNCPDWQKEFLSQISNLNVAALNPRREFFDLSNASLSEEQVAWEFFHLARADQQIFWFPKETDCPITLYELGFWLQSEKPIAVGIESGYRKDSELSAYIKLHRPEIPICNSLAELAETFRSSFREDYSICKEIPVAKDIDANSLFLAGGIERCPDWQSLASKLLLGQNLEIYNPRSSQDTFGIKDINTNHQNLLKSGKALFWFCKETLNTSALFELGVVAGRKDIELYVGVEEGYARSFDVHYQLSQSRPEIRVASSLQELCSEVFLGR